MLPGALTWRAERGHRSLPVGVEAVPPFCSLSTCKGWLCWYLREGAEFLPEILLAFGVLWIAP